MYMCSTIVLNPAIAIKLHTQSCEKLCAAIIYGLYVWIEYKASSVLTDECFDISVNVLTCISVIMRVSNLIQADIHENLTASWYMLLEVNCRHIIHELIV